MLRAAVLGVIAVFVHSQLEPATAAAPVSMIRLDPTFGAGGYTITDIGGPGDLNGPEDEPFWMAVQPDGKFVTAGKSRNPGSGNYDFTIIRYTASGALDTSFGWYGLVLVDFLGAHDEAAAVAIQADGKVIVGGLAGRPGGQSDMGFVRLNANGTRDTSFGWNGLVMVDFGGQADQLIALVVQPDGKIIGAGSATRPSTGLDFALVRLNSNGAQDSTFGLNGLLTANFWGRADGVTKMALQTDGKIVVAGVATRTDGSTDFALARYLPNGTRDGSFGWGGLVAQDFLGRDDVGYALLIQPDGKLLVGGLAWNPNNSSNDLALARYNSNGQLDLGFAAFGAPGILVMDFAGAYDQALWLLLQPDDKIVAIGHAVHPTTGFDFAIARFTTAGDPDESLSPGGRFTDDIFGGPDGLHAGALTADGKLVVTGDAYNPSTSADDFVIARYLIADPSWIGGVLAKLPAAAFDSASHKASLVALMGQAQADVLAGAATSATARLQELRSRADGCGAVPAADDWIVSCAAQTQVRTLVDQVLSKLQ